MRVVDPERSHGIVEVFVGEHCRPNVPAAARAAALGLLLVRGDDGRVAKARLVQPLPQQLDVVGGEGAVGSNGLCQQTAAW